MIYGSAVPGPTAESSHGFMTYYIAPRFLDKIAVHISKSFLDLPRVKVPLILGIHGRKGEGKTFQCELAYQKLGVEVVHISGGELESPDAGDPARLVRLRYREAAELIRVRGKMTVLMINDLDAGAGRFDSTTQYTVNTQLVNNTLMNIADNPTNVQLPGSYDEKPTHRVPIIVTGNDFSTLYAPLIRDGRMEKFYWEPNRDDKIGIVNGIFEPDGLGQNDIMTLVDTFIDQSVDFFGALRSRIYDDLVRQFINQTGFENLSMRLVNSPDGKPKLPQPDFRLNHLLEAGQEMVAEQRRVREMRLVREYNEVLQQGRGRDFTIEQDSTSQPMRSNGHQSVRHSSDHPSNYASGNSTHAQSPSSPSSSPKKPTQHKSNGHGFDGAQLDAATVQQVEQLLTQGHRVGLEYADQRRFRSNSWHSCASLSSSDPTEALQVMEQCLIDHPADYVRMIGIDSTNKRRILEKIIQRP